MDKAPLTNRTEHEAPGCFPLQIESGFYLGSSRVAYRTGRRPLRRPF